MKVSSSPTSDKSNKNLKFSNTKNKNISSKKAQVSQMTSSSSFDHFSELWSCPLCMEQVDHGDINFTPCECGYQICRFCWHRIKSILNDQCPACRRSYSEQLERSLGQLTASPLIKNEGKEMANKKPTYKGRSHISETDAIVPLPNNGTRGGAPLGNVLSSRKHLIDVRVLQSNLVYIVGIPLSPSIYHMDLYNNSSVYSPQFISALEELLSSKKYFGKYGKLLKLVINTKGPHHHYSITKSSSSIPTVSAFLTFEKTEDAAEAIKNLDNSSFIGYTLKATYGTTKYCAFFLRGQPCPNYSTCLYLHELGQQEHSFTKLALSESLRITRTQGDAVAAESQGCKNNQSNDSLKPEMKFTSSSDFVLNEFGSKPLDYLDLLEFPLDIDTPNDEFLLDNDNNDNDTEQKNLKYGRSSSRFAFVEDLSFHIPDLFKSFKSPLKGYSTLLPSPSNLVTTDNKVVSQSPFLNPPLSNASSTDIKSNVLSSYLEAAKIRTDKEEFVSITEPLSPPSQLTPRQRKGKKSQFVPSESKAISFSPNVRLQSRTISTERSSKKVNNKDSEMLSLAQEHNIPPPVKIMELNTPTFQLSSSNPFMFLLDESISNTEPVEGDSTNIPVDSQLSSITTKKKKKSLSKLKLDKPVTPLPSSIGGGGGGRGVKGSDLHYQFAEVIKDLQGYLDSNCNPFDSSSDMLHYIESFTTGNILLVLNNSFEKIKPSYTSFPEALETNLLEFDKFCDENNFKREETSTEPIRSSAYIDCNTEQVSRILCQVEMRTSPLLDLFSRLLLSLSKFPFNANVSVDSYFAKLSENQIKLSELNEYLVSQNRNYFTGCLEY